MEMDKKGPENGDTTIKYRGMKAMPFVIGNEAFEKLGTIGTSSNLLVYFTTVFNMRSVAATNLVNIFNGSANFGTLLGAFLCDTYFGRYKTLGFCCVASFVGLSLLALTAAIPELHPPHCGAAEGGSGCTGPTGGQMAFLIGGLSLLVVGAGGIRPCNLAFGADQFDPRTEPGKRGISSFFNWYYFTLTFAIMVSVTLVVYIQSSVSWSLGLAIPASFMLMACALFLLGSQMYVKVEPKGSPLVGVAQVIVAAFRKKRLGLPPQKASLALFDHLPDHSANCRLSHSDQFRFLDKAAIITEEDSITPEGSAGDPWKLCAVQQVEQVKCLVRVFPIWVSGIFYHTAAVTISNYVVFQALQSDRRLGGGGFRIPAASYSVFTMLTITLWIPFYDRIIVPRLRRVTGKPDGITVLQKMGAGIILMVVTLVLCALVEVSRRTAALTRPTLGAEPHRGAISAMSGMWLVIPLVSAGLSEAFSMISLVEFYYKQFPENMRSIGGAFLFCGLAMSSYLSSFLQTVAIRMSRGPEGVSWLADDLNEGRLDYFYYLLAGLELVNFFCFLVCARWYRYRGESGDGGPVGEETGNKKSEIALV